MRCTLDTTLTIFSQNYLSFLDQIAKSASVTVRNLIVDSISTGSVDVLVRITSFSSPGSTDAIYTQNNLNQLLNSGFVGSMALNSFTISTDGGSNSDSSSSASDSGLPLTTIIILSVVIPVGILRTYPLT